SEELRALADDLAASDSGASTAGTGQLEAILDHGMRARSEEQRRRGVRLVAELVQRAAAGQLGAESDPEAGPRGTIGSIDRQLTAQLNEVYRHRAVQQLEATWRGLAYLVDRTETGSQLQIRVLDVSKDELIRDLKMAVEIDQSWLFKRVYEDEYGTRG